MKIFEVLAGSLAQLTEAKGDDPPVVICEAQIDRFASTYPQLNRAEIILMMVRFGPKRNAVEEAMRWKASSKMAPASTP